MNPTCIYNYERRAVYLTDATLAPNPAFCGTLLDTHDGIEHTVYATWTAMPTPQGYVIRITTLQGRAFESSQSATLNLGLEVAAFARGVL